VTLVELLFFFIIVAWLPGAVIFRLPVADRDRRAALDAEERLFWAVIVSCALSTSIVLVLALAHRYTLERLVAADVAIAVIAAAAARFKLTFGPRASRPRLWSLLPLALIVFCVWRFFPPSEYIMGGKDPGVYMNEGIQIAQRGTLVFNDPVVATLPSFARPLFFPPSVQPSVYSLRFMGFYVRNPDTGAVVGQFPHFFPASIAIGYGLDGLTGARRVVGFWAILGVLALYFVAARLIGRLAAAAAAALLALHVIDVWFGRYPNSELVMQALLFAALLATARSHVDDDRFFAPVAGALLGLLLFVRFDAVLGIAAVVAALALGLVAGGRLRMGFFVGLGLTVGLAIAYMSSLMRAYVDLPIIFVSNLLWWHYLLLILGGVIAVAAIAAGARFESLSSAVRRGVPMLISFAVVGAAIYAMYFREPADRLLAERDAYALRIFASFYLTVPGLLAALLGFVLLARRAFWSAPELFLTIATFSFFFFYKIRIVSDHFWMTRRFLPVVLPGAVLFIAAAASIGAQSGAGLTRLLRGTIGAVFIALLAAQYSRASAPILDHIEYAGLISKLEQLAGSIHDRDLLLVEARNASDTHVLTLPLAYTYARNVLVLASPRPDKSLLAPVLEWARTKYDRVLFIGGGGTDLLSPAWSVRPIASDRFQIPEYDAPKDAYPRFVQHKEFDYGLYEITPPNPEDAAKPFDLDIGVRDDLYVLRFHAKEETEGRTFRWSRNPSYITVTNLRANSREMVFWMSDGGRPPAAGRAEVTVRLDNDVLGSVQVDTGFKPYTFAIPADVAQRIAVQGGTAELRLSTPTWVPAQVLGTSDPRDLGVMVDRVTVK
jgi:hypothetical protein